MKAHTIFFIALMFCMGHDIIIKAQTMTAPKVFNSKANSKVSRAIAEVYQVTATLEISPDKKTAAVRVAVKNVSKVTAIYFASGFPEEFHFEVLDQAGKVPPLTKYGKQILGPRDVASPLSKGLIMTPMCVAIPLAPQAETVTESTVSYLYDMSKLGIYNITAVEVIDNNSKQPLVIKSNTLNLWNTAAGFSQGPHSPAR